jgi:cell division protein FtsQ
VNARTTIRKVLFVSIWVCIAGGMLTLLLAAINNKNKNICTDYHISLKNKGRNFFVDEKDVEKILLAAKDNKIRGQLINSFNLHSLESMLEKNVWVSRAEIYFDNRDVMHVIVSEKEPVARIFTITGQSYYIDSTGSSLPLSDKESALVPVFTGFPVNRVIAPKDKALLEQVRNMAVFILQDPFWMSQVAQIDITDRRTFEMIPTVGSHIVRLGDGEQVDQKFRRLMIFYQQVLRKTGFDHYKMIDVQYKGQVVAAKYLGDPKIDSVLWKKSVQKLLAQSMEE